MIVDEVVARRELYDGDVVVSESKSGSNGDEWDEDEGSLFQAYVKRMRCNGQIGDAVCIAAFSRLFQTDVVVYAFDDTTGSLTQVRIENTGKEDERGLTRLGWYPSRVGVDALNHYISVHAPAEGVLWGGKEGFDAGFV